MVASKQFVATIWGASGRMFTAYLTIFVVHYANLKSRVANLRKSRNKSSLLAQTLRISIIHNHKYVYYLSDDICGALC
jgi:hypothetical protein